MANNIAVGQFIVGLESADWTPGPGLHHKACNIDVLGRPQPNLQPVVYVVEASIFLDR